MSLILNNGILKNNLLYNLKLFKSRFPDLASMMNFKNEKAVLEFAEQIPDSYTIKQTKAVLNENPVYSISVNGKFIHSKYNPLKEAEQTYLSFFSEKQNKNTQILNSCVFYGLGLGFIPEFYIKDNPVSSVTIIEPDIFIFIIFLSNRPLDIFFSHKNLNLILGAYPSQVLDFLESEHLNTAPAFKQQAVIEAESFWFLEFEDLKKRRKQKNELNKNTLKKFGDLWLKNFFKNLNSVSKLEGIIRLKNIYKDFPAIVIAAGPSLNKQLSLIKKYTEKFIIIASDTSVRACLKNGIIPDFILLMDAQYWNYLHIADLDISSSVLITESSVYPAVFRKKAKAVFLCTSVFPLAGYIEDKVDNKGKIVTGGSVATAAWDFARFLGINQIIMAGLDLAFSDFKTHFWGSRFEEDSVITSTRIIPAETVSHRVLYSAYPEIKDGYQGKVLTDKRLQMYAWWFESKLAEFPKIKTYNLMPVGLKIPNMPPLLKEEFLKKVNVSVCTYPYKTKKIEGIIFSCKKNGLNLKNKIMTVLNGLEDDLLQAEKLSKEAAELCGELIGKNTELSENVVSKCGDRLSVIDNALCSNKANIIIGFNLLLEDIDYTANSSSENSFLEIYKSSEKLYKIINNSINNIINQKRRLRL